MIERSDMDHDQTTSGDDVGTSTDPASESAAAPRRRIDVVSLVAGLVFLVMAAAFALAGLDSLEEQVRLVWPTALLGIGLGMLLGTRDR